MAAVKLYLQDFVYQASYKLTSGDLHVVVEKLQSGFGWEHTQFVVNFLQTFALLKQLRAHSGMPVRSTSGFPGHCESYQSSVRFQQSQLTLSCMSERGGGSKQGNRGDCRRVVAKTHVQAHTRGFGLLQKQSVVIPPPQSISAPNILFKVISLPSSSPGGAGEQGMKRRKRSIRSTNFRGAIGHLAEVHVCISWLKLDPRPRCQ